MKSKKVCVRGVQFVCFKAKDSSQRSCIKNMLDTVKVKAQDSEGNLHLSLHAIHPKLLSSSEEMPEDLRRNASRKGIP